MKIKRKILPDLQKNTDGQPLKQQLYTLPNIKAVVDWMQWNVRFNVMEHRPVVTGKGLDLSAAMQEFAVHAIEDNLRRVGINPGERVPMSLATLGKADSFHPMEDWYTAVEWDGVDRISELANTVPTNSELWPTYLEKWLLQVIEATTGWRDHTERAIPHCLVFGGAQGLGKTQWFRNLAPGFVRTEAELHLSKSDAKDHKLDVLRFPMVELSEIDATFGRSENSTLKTFLSAGRDTIRPPYGRRMEDRIRASVFAGTVNDLTFLKDPTGSRRFWPIEITDKIAWQHRIDTQQLFAQALTLWEEGKTIFLNEQEEAIRIQDAVKFEDVSPIADRLASHWADHGEKLDDAAALSVSEICDALRVGQHPAVVSAARSWLTKTLGKPKTIGKKQRSWVVPGVSHLDPGDRYSGQRLDETTAKKYTRWHLS